MIFIVIWVELNAEWNVTGVETLFNLNISAFSKANTIKIVKYIEKCAHYIGKWFKPYLFGNVLEK